MPIAAAARRARRQRTCAIHGTRHGAVRVYLAALDEQGAPATVSASISPTDPAARWTAVDGPAFYAYSTNYLIDVQAGIIDGWFAEQLRARKRHQRAYSKGGSALRTSFVAPTRTKLPSTCLVSWVSRIKTSRFPTPKKPPTPMIAYDLVMSGARTISSTVPILSLLSLKTGIPSTWRFALQPRVANSRSSNAVMPWTVDPAPSAL